MTVLRRAIRRLWHRVFVQPVLNELEKRVRGQLDRFDRQQALAKGSMQRVCWQMKESADPEGQRGKRGDGRD